MLKKILFIYKQLFKPYKKVEIHLGNSIEATNCLKYFNKRSFRKLLLKNKRYNISLIQLSIFNNSDEYISSIKGKNSADYFHRRCEKMQYKFAKINPNDFIDSIFEINSSSEIRQGKKMDNTYLNKTQNYPSNDINNWYGVFTENNELIAYIWTLQLNDLVIINRILGHKLHLKNNIMYFLCVNLVKKFIDDKKFKFLMYDTFGLKENGLVLFKKRIGFKSYTVNFVA